MGMIVPRAVETDAQNITVTLPVVGAMQAALILQAQFFCWEECGDIDFDRYAAAVQVMHALRNAIPTEAVQ